MFGSVRLLLLLLVATSAPHGVQQRDEDPRATVRQALRSVEGGSVAALSARWLSDAAHGSRVARLGLATIYRLTYRYDAAEREYRALLTTAPRHPDLIDAYARLGRGLALSTRGEPPAAARELARALHAARIVHDSAAEVEILTALAAARRQSDGAPSGVATLDSALRLVAPADSELLGRVLCARASVRSSLAQPDAYSEATTGMRLAENARDPRTVATCLRARESIVRISGVSTATGGPLDSAIVLLQQIAALQRNVHDHAGVALTLTHLAAVQIGDSHLGTARQSVHQSLGYATRVGDRATEATDNYLLGIISMRLGDTGPAAKYLHQAIAAFDSLGDVNGAMVVRSNLPDLATLTGDTASAMREARRALAYFQKHGDVSIVIAIRRSTAAIERTAHRWNAARAQLDTARSEARSHGSAELARELVSDYGRLALDAGNLAEAEQLWTASLSAFTQAEQLDRYEALVRLADIHARMGQRDRARRELTLASERLDRWRGALPDRELRLFAFQAASDAVGDPGNSVANVIAALAAHGQAGAALTLADQRRARTVADALLRNSAAHDARGGLAAAPAGSLDQSIASQLPDSVTALIEYSAAARNTPITQFVVTRAGARAYVLSPADSIAPVAQRLSALIEGRMTTTGPARQLGALLLDSAVANLPPGIRRLVLVPDGVLQRVPFDVLLLQDGRMVVDRFATATVPSAAVLLALWRRPATTRPARLLAFGDPVFGEAASADTTRSTLSGDSALPRLPGSATEVRLVARFAPDAEIRLRSAATADFLTHTPLRKYSVIHFATHALVDDHDNAATALALAPTAGESGFVSPAQLAALQLDADMVVLSACRSARGVLIGGEGVQGLTTPLLEAGARSVVASRWLVGDQHAAKFIVDFYSSLARGLPVSDALRAAKLSAIARGATPDEWAAFKVVGDPLVRIRLTLPEDAATPASNVRDRTALLAIIVTIIAIVLAIVASRRYRATRKAEIRDRIDPPAPAPDTHHE